MASKPIEKDKEGANKNEGDTESEGPGVSSIPGFAEEDFMKLSHLLNTNATINEKVAGLFQKQALQLMSETSGKLRVADKAWLIDYLANQNGLYERIMKNNDNKNADKQERDANKTEKQETLFGSKYQFLTPKEESKSREDARTPPLSMINESYGVEPRHADREACQSNTVPKIKLNELVQRPATFNGNNPPARRWLDDYERAAEANAWSDALKVRYFSTFLESCAHDWHVTIAKRKLGLTPEWNDLRAAFIRHYLGDCDRRALRQQLESCRQGENERAVNFIPRVMRLINLINTNMSEDECVEIIRDKLRKEYSEKLVLANIYTLEQLNDNCLKVEAELTPKRFQSKDGAKNFNKNRKTQGSEGTNTAPGYRETSSRSQSTNQEGIKTCYRCGRKGHVSRECFASTRITGESLPKTTRKQSQDLYQNHKDSKTIATVQEDEEKEEHTESEAPTLNYINTIMAPSINMIGGSLPEVQVSLDGVLTNATVDSGAAYSVINVNLALEHQWPVKRVDLKLQHAAGGNLKVRGIAEIKTSVKIQNREVTKTASFVIVEGLCAQVILGIDMSKRFGLIIDPSRSPQVYFRPKEKGVRSAGQQILKARSVNLIQAKVDIETAEIVTRNFNFNGSLQSVNSIVQVNAEGKTLVPVANLDVKDITIDDNMQIASFSIFKEHDNKQGASISQILELEEGFESFVYIGNKLNPEQVKNLSDLFEKHKKAFSLKGELGRCNSVHHEIDLTPGAQPFREARRRHPPAHAMEADKQVNEMLKKDIIETSTSPWASEYVMVRKKDNTWRLCIDFRRLNKMTKINAFPLPDIEECIATLGGKTYFSKLDFQSGYWQVPIAPSSRELTAFRTRQGLYQFKVMPFGLCNAPASFQKLINLMFAGIRGLNVQLFLDDVCIATHDWVEHLEILDQVLSIVERHNMKLNSKKCEFGLTEVIFLGHKLSQKGVQQDPAKLEALTLLPPPTDVSGVRRLLGGFGYYRRFVFNFAAITAPISKLTRKAEPFVWGQEQQHALDTIKKELLANATLTNLDAVGEIVVKTDASKSGIAGLIQQMQNKDWKLVTCCSRGLTESEKNYSITELEALAVVYCLTKLRYYLLGRKFTILVDHQALTVWNKSKIPNNERLQRWALILADFDCKIVYVKGKTHEDVDLLSRAPVSTMGDDFLPNVLMITPLDKIPWKDAYEKDKWIEKANSQVDGFYKLDGVVYRKQKLFVPPSKRNEVITESHNAILAGHDGVDATWARMEAYFWWPGMRKDVEDWIKRCHICQMRKVPRRKPPGLMRHHVANRPMEKVALDHLGKLPSAITGECFVIVAIDVYSKYVVARAVEAQTSVLVEKFFVDFCSAFGVPHCIVTDNSMAFMSQNMKEITRTLNVEMIQAVPRHSRGNAVAERAIESVQEKLSILTKSESLDWAAALPFAVLSLNTRRHATTGFTPYQLFFHREANPIQHCVNASNNQNHMSEAALEQLELAHANAVANTSDNQARSKILFDEKRPNEKFDIGDQVLIRASDRAPKLADKYEGPFEVSSREDDIYEVRRINSGRSDVRRRHVSQMKKYLGLILAISLILSCASALHLRQTSPIYWVEQESKFVSAGLASAPYYYHFLSPCEMILSYGDLLARTGGSPFILRQPNWSRDPNRHLPGQETTEAPDRRKRQALPQLPNPPAEPLSPPPPVFVAAQTLHKACVDEANLLTEDLSKFNTELVRPTEGQPERTKRQLAFIGGVIVDNLYQTFFHLVKTQENPESLHTEVNKAIQNLQKKINLLKVATRILNRNEAKITSQVGNLQKNVEQIPSIEVFANHVISQIQQQRAIAQRLETSLAENKLDTVTLAQFFKMQKFDQLEARDVTITSTDYIPANVIRFHMSGHIRSRSTKVYQVHAISHFTNYTGTPVRNDYEGRNWLIYNATSDCAKGINAGVNAIITDDCPTTKFRDPNLQLWHRVPSPNAKKDARRSVSIPVWPYILVYCWGNRIQIDGEWTECPPYTCLLQNTQSFKSSDGLVEHTAKTQQDNIKIRAKFDVQGFHIPNYEAGHVTLNKNIKQIDELLGRVNDSIAIQWGQTEVSWFHISLAHSAIMLVLVSSIVIWGLCRKMRPKLHWPMWNSPCRHNVAHVAEQAVSRAREEIRLEVAERMSEFNNAICQTTGVRYSRRPPSHIRYFLKEPSYPQTNITIKEID